jgi:N-acetylglucosaminyl-diphospho-decaprenol L-rhamnosyltransferase
VEDLGMKKLSIIIVNWNVRPLLADCLRSILAQVDLAETEILVVDSASTDGSVEMIRNDFPQIQLMAQSENVGFTRGNNLALQVAEGQFHLLLNPDTVIMGDALQQMMNFLETHPAVGIVGPHTLNTDGSYQSTRRRFPTILTAFFESTWLQNLAPRRLLDHYYVKDAPQSATVEVDWVQGSALMARRQVYKTIGGLDEGYIMYSEELDWCHRAKDAGFGVAYLGSARIIHHGGKSSEQASARKHITFQQSKLRYFRKFHSHLAAEGLRIGLLLGYAVQLIEESIKSLLGHKRSMRQERIQTYWQVLRSGLKVN